MSGENGYPNTTKQKGNSGWYSSKKKPESPPLNMTLPLKKRSALAGLTVSSKKSMLKNTPGNLHQGSPEVSGQTQIRSE